MDERKNQIKEVAEKLFSYATSSAPSVNRTLIPHHANEIVSAWYDGLAVDQILQSDKSPEKDKEAIEKASRQISRAANALSELGYFGGKEIETLVVSIKQSLQDTPSDPFVPAHLAGPQLADILKGLADGLSSRAAYINTNALPLSNVLDGSVERRGYQYNGAAHECGYAVSNAYFAITSRRPTIISSSGDGWQEAYGPFLYLIEDVLRIFSFSGSAEHIARASGQRWRMENQT